MDDVSEASRLAILASYDVLDASPEEGFDDIVHLAAQLCAAPIAVVGLKAADRQWFKARVGLPPGETDPACSICAHALSASDLLIIPDLTSDARTAASFPTATEARFRFVAGAPLRVDAGLVLGSLCVIDTVPRLEGLTGPQRDGLRRLARQVVSLIENRRLLKQRERILLRQEAQVQQHVALLAAQQAVNRAGGNLDAVARALVVGAMKALPQSEGGVVELIEGNELVYRSPQGVIGGYGGLRIPLRGSLAGRSALTGLPLRIGDVRQEKGVSQELLARLGVRSCLMVPVARFGRVAGVLKLQSGRPNAFSDDDLQVARLFAGEVTTGLAEMGEAIARKAARASENRFRSVFDSIVDFAIIVTDTEGKVTEWNTGAEHVLGWSRAEMRGHGLDRFFTPEDRHVGRPETEMRLALERGRASDERWHLRSDGSLFWASGELMPVRDEEGVHRGFVKAVRDRTAEHRSGEILRETEARLRESEDHFRHTVELNPAVPWTCDPQGNITSSSRRWLDMTGQAPGEPDGAGWMKALHPDDLPHTLAVFSDCLVSGQPVDVDYRVRIAGTGEHRWMRARAYPRRDAGGAIVQWYGVVEDIHDHRLAEVRLRESEALFRTFAQAVPNHIWSAAPDGALDWANEPTYAYLGRPDEVLGNAWAQRVHPDDLPRVRERWASSLATGDVYETEFRVRRVDEVYRWFLVRALPIRGPGGVVERWIGANTDIEDQRAATEELAHVNAVLEERVEERTRELRDAQDFVRLALSAVGGVGVWTYDVASDRFRGDHAIADLYAIDRERTAAGIPRTAFLANVVPEDLDSLKATMAGGLVRSGDLELEYRIRHPDGSIHWVLSRGHTYFDEAHNPVRRTGIGVETTRQRELEQQLRQSQKMEAVGQLTGGLAHDFNNLLTGISGSLDLLQKRVVQGRIDELDRYFVAAQGASKRAAALTHRLLAFSRRQTLDPRPIDVRRLISGMIDLIRRTVGPAITVETLGKAGLWTARVDASQLENALLNLVINARDAMPDGGRVTIETTNQWLDERTARARDLTPGPYLRLCVSDTGSGMSAQVIAKAFDPFFTTKPIGQGTGLGLSMIYGFARQSGGNVHIESDVGKGTVVSIHLPRHDGTEDAQDGATARSDLPRAVVGETVLVIDDEPTVRMLVTDVLADLGYAALEAGDGPSGLSMLQSDARVDLLVTDVGLPGGMNGRQVADAARVLRPRLKVLFITGYAENAAVGNGELDPGMAVMTKPFAMDDLAAKLRALIES